MDAAGPETKPDLPAAEFVEEVVVQRVRWPAIAQPRGDATREACLALREWDLTVTEDGRPARVTSIDREGGPARFILLVDTSTSMLEPLEFIRPALTDFVRRLSPGNEFVVYTFDADLHEKVPATRDTGALARAIASIEASGLETALVDALWEVLDRHSEHVGREILLLVSDGGENSSESYRLKDLLARVAERRDLRIFNLAPEFATRDHRSLALLLWLAETTGGRTDFVRERHHVPGALDNVVARLRDEIIVGYVPPEHSRKGRRRGKVEVRIRERDDLACRVREAAPSRTLRLTPP